MALNWTEFVDTNYISGYDIQHPLKVKLAKVTAEEVVTPKTNKKEKNGI